METRPKKDKHKLPSGSYRTVTFTDFVIKRNSDKILLVFFQNRGIIFFVTDRHGDIAQLGERCVRNAKVAGSNPVVSTWNLVFAAERGGYGVFLFVSENRI